MNVAMVGAKVPPWSSNVSRNITNALFALSSTVYVQGEFLAPITTAGAVPLGQVTSCGWAFFFNTDVTNFVTIRNGVSAADLIELKPGEFFLGPLLPACTPFILANVAACLVEFLIFSR